MGTRHDKYETRVYLKPETAEQLEKAIQWWKDYEETAPTFNHDIRLNNGKIDREKVLRLVLERFNEEKGRL